MPEFSALAGSATCCCCSTREALHCVDKSLLTLESGSTPTPPSVTLRQKLDDAAVSDPAATLRPDAVTTRGVSRLPTVPLSVVVVMGSTSGVQLALLERR